MGFGSKAGDLAFKGLTGGLGFITIYLTATFSVNVYRGLAWHNAQSDGGVSILLCVLSVTDYLLRKRNLRSRAPMNNPLDTVFLAAGNS